MLALLLFVARPAPGASGPGEGPSALGSEKPGQSESGEIESAEAGLAESDSAEGGSTGSESTDSENSEYEATEKSTGPWHRSPSAIMFRSTLIPGWGQLANGKRIKAAVVLGAEGYLIYRGMRARQRESDALAAAEKDPSREALWLAEATVWNEEKRDYAWWTLFAVILSMGDAYVDAHLRGFDTEFDPESGQTQLRWHWTFN